MHPLPSLPSLPSLTELRQRAREHWRPLPLGNLIASWRLAFRHSGQQSSVVPAPAVATPPLPAAPHHSPLYTHDALLHVPQNANARHQAERAAGGFNQRLAVFITRYFGSMGGFYALVVWMFSWMALATFNFWLFRLDHYPFQFLLFLSNLVQLFALPVIMVGQNVLSRHAELQADEQFKATIKTLHDSEQVVHHLDAQDTELVRQTVELLKQTPMLEELLTLLRAQTQTPPASTLAPAGTVTLPAVPAAPTPPPPAPPPAPTPPKRSRSVKAKAAKGTSEVIQ